MQLLIIATDSSNSPTPSSSTADTAVLLGVGESEESVDNGRSCESGGVSFRKYWVRVVRVPIVAYSCAD